MFDHNVQLKLTAFLPPPTYISWAVSMVAYPKCSTILRRKITLTLTRAPLLKVLLIVHLYIASLSSEETTEARWCQMCLSLWPSLVCRLDHRRRPGERFLQKNILETIFHQTSTKAQSMNWITLQMFFEACDWINFLPPCNRHCLKRITQTNLDTGQPFLLPFQENLTLCRAVLEVDPI